MKRLNIKLIVILFVSLAVFVGGGMFIHHIQVESGIDSTRVQAVKMLEDGDYRTARKLFNQFIQHHDSTKPEERVDDETLGQLTECYKQIRESYKEKLPEIEVQIRDRSFVASRLEKVVQDYPDYLPVRRELIEWYRIYRSSRQELAHLQNLNSSLIVKEANIEVRLAQLLVASDPIKGIAPAVIRLSKVVGYQWSEYVLDKEGKPTSRKTSDDDKVLFKPKIALDINSITAYDQLARLLHSQLKQPKHARAVVDQMVAVSLKNKKDKDQLKLAYTTRCQYLIQISKGDEKLIALSKEDADKALAIDPADLDAIIVRAGVARIEKDYKLAYQLLDQGLQKHPQESKLYISKVDSLIAENKTQDALDTIELGIQALTEERFPSDLYARRVGLEIQQSEIEKARATIDLLEGRNASAEFLLFYRGRVNLVDKKYIQAIQQLKKVSNYSVFSKNASQMSMVNNLLASAYSNIGQFDLALTHYKKLTTQRNKYAMDLPIALTLGRLGKRKEAIKIYRKLANQAANQPPKVADAIWKSNNFSSAYFNLELMLQQRHEKEDQRWQTLNAILKKMKQVDFPKEGARTTLELNLLLTQKNIASAKKLVANYEKKITADEDADEADWTTLAEQKIRLLIEQMRKKTRQEAIELADNGLKMLHAMKEKTGDNYQTRRLRTQLVFIRGGEKLSKELQDLEKPSDSIKKENFAGLLQFIGEQYLRRGNYSETFRLYEKVASLDPENLQIRVKIFDLALGTNIVEQIKKSLNEIEALAGKDDAVAVFCRIKHLASKIKDDENKEKRIAAARKMLSKVIIQRPDWDQPYMIEAKLYGFENNQVKARELYEKVLVKNPTSSEALQKKAQIQQLKGEYEAAKKTYAQIGLNNSDPRIIRRGIQLEYQAGNVDKAVRLAKEYMDDSKNRDTVTATDLSWYAELNARAKKNSIAKKAYLEAAEKSPADITIGLNAIRFLARSKDSQAAGKILRNLQLSLPEDQASQVLARCFFAIGNFREAEKRYKDDVKSDPGNIAARARLTQFYLKLKQANQFFRGKAYRELDWIINHADQKNDEEKEFLFWARREKAGMLAQEQQDYQKFLWAVQLIDDNKEDGKLSNKDLFSMIRVLSTRNEHGSLVEALALLDEVKKRRGGTLSPNEQMSKIELLDKTGKWNPEGETAMLKLLDLGENPDYIYNYLKLSIKNNRTTVLETNLNKLFKIEPDSLRTKEITIQVAIALKKIPQAVLAIRKMTPSQLKSSKKLTPDQIQEAVQTAVLWVKVAPYTGKSKDKAYKETVKIYDKLIDKVDARYAFQFQISKARVLVLQNKVDDAFEILEQIKKEQTTPQVAAAALSFLRLAGSNAKQENFEKTTKWVKEFINLSPDSYVPLNIYAQLLDLQGKSKESYTVYQQILKTKSLPNKHKGIILNNMAYMQYQMGTDLESSLKNVNEAMKYLGKNSDLLDTRGMIFFGMKKYKDAQLDLEEAVAGRSNPLNFFHLSLIHWRQKDKNATEVTLRRAYKRHFKTDTLSVREKKLFDELPADLVKRASRKF